MKNIYKDPDKSSRVSDSSTLFVRSVDGCGLYLWEPVKVFRLGSDVIHVGFKEDDFGVTVMCELNIERPKARK